MSNNGKVLIVDDDKNILRSLEIFLETEFEKVKTLSNPNLLLNELNNGYDVVMLDMNFSAGINTGNEGLYWLGEVIKKDPQAVVVMITAYGDVDLAVKAMQKGATDFVIKPWNNEKLLSTLKACIKIRRSNKKIEKLHKEKENLSEVISNVPDKIIGSSEAILGIYKVIEKVSKTDANILILGENGTGKELIAREIHKRSDRASKPLITVDLSTISESLFESELFGHKKGAFTDAKEDRTGRFEVANGGTLFLDEIGNVPLSLQAKILTVLQQREIKPVGSNDTVPIDIRLICATNKNLEKLIAEGLFREDLFYRINTIKLELPPLRERDDDIVLLAEHYLKFYSAKYEKPFLKFNSKTLDALMAYNWPGNIRELRHTIEKTVILSDTNTITHSDLMLKNSPEKQSSDNWPLKFEDIERKAIIRSLQNNKNKLIDAAKELGITRQTLYNKCKKYGIDY